jgi:hypothetical protein
VCVQVPCVYLLGTASPVIRNTEDTPMQELYATSLCMYGPYVPSILGLQGVLPDRPWLRPHFYELRHPPERL